MRSGTCPKCGGTEIYGARNGFSIGELNRVSIRPHVPDGFRGALVPRQTNDLWHYVCATCGLSETYLHDAAAIDYIRQQWVRVQPPT